MVKLFDIISQADEFEIAPRQAANLDSALSLTAAKIPIFPVTVFRDATGKWKKKPAITGWQLVFPYGLHPGDDLINYPPDGSGRG
jgi:hypothetical protein